MTPGAGQRTISKPASRTEWPLDAAMPEPVELPVCPKCGHVGKNPGGSYMTYACVGAEGERHRRTRMVRMMFQPVLSLPAE